MRQISSWDRCVCDLRQQTLANSIIRDGASGRTAGRLGAVHHDARRLPTLVLMLVMVAITVAPKRASAFRGLAIDAGPRASADSSMSPLRKTGGMVIAGALVAGGLYGMSLIGASTASQVVAGMMAYSVLDPVASIMTDPVRQQVKRATWLLTGQGHLAGVNGLNGSDIDPATKGEHTKIYHASTASFGGGPTQFGRDTLFAWNRWARGEVRGARVTLRSGRPDALEEAAAELAFMLVGTAQHYPEIGADTSLLRQLGSLLTRDLPQDVVSKLHSLTTRIAPMFGTTSSDRVPALATALLRASD